MTQRRPAHDGSRVALERYRRLGPTGFLHPVSAWSVTADGKERHAGRNKRDAERAFKTWCRIAPEKHIQLLQNTAVINERKPIHA